MSLFNRNLEMQTRLELERRVEQVIKQVISDHVNAHPGDPEAVHAADDTPQELDRLRNLFHEHMGIQATDDIFSDLKAIMRSDNLERFVRAVIRENVDPHSVDQILDRLSDPERGLETILQFTETQARQSLFGAMQSMARKDKNSTEDYFNRNLDNRTATNILGNRTELGAAHFGFEPEEARRGIDHFKSLLDREVGSRVGLVSGEAGLVMLSDILAAKKRVDIGMFQLEHPTILSALKAQQRIGTTIQLMLTPPGQGRTQKKASEIGWMNQVAENVLGRTSVQFDPTVMGGTAGYAHQKFIGIDLDAEDYRQASVMIGSFNMTRGALGQIVDRAGNLVRRSPHNFELGLNISYELVSNRGLREDTFAQIIQETRAYRDWLFGRVKDPSIKPPTNPEHILTGPQTHQQIQKSLGLGTNAKVNAFFMLNVMTDKGMVLDQKARTGFYYDVEQTLRNNQESRITIFVSRGFDNLRQQDIGGETDPTKSKAFQMLKALEAKSEGRLKLIETQQLIHAKTAVIFRDGVTDVITGSANISQESLTGGVHEVGMFLSSRHFKDRLVDDGPDWLTEQSRNVLSYMWSIATRSVARGSLIETSNASSRRILSELKDRLNPDLSRLVTVKDIVRYTGSGERVIIGSVVNLGLRIQDKNRRVIDIPDAFSFRVYEHEHDPNRVYIPELHKIIDPVLALSSAKGVKRGVGGRRGQLTALEVEPAGVIAAALEHMQSQLTHAGLTLMGEFTGPLGLAALAVERQNRRTMKILEYQLKGMASKHFRDVFKHFEGLPIGEYASDARKFRRLVYGLQMKELAQDASSHLKTLAREYSGHLVTQAVPMLSLAASLIPKMDPASIEASFNNIQDWELGFELGGRRVKGNAPSDVLRRRMGGQVTREGLLFTVLAQSMPWDAPANLFLAEGFQQLAATDFDEERQMVQFFMNPAKLDQLAQRFQNMLGADSGFWAVGYKTLVDNPTGYLRSAKMPVAGSHTPTEKVKQGARLNIALLWGLNEQALVHADLFRGATVARKVEKTLPVSTFDMINTADTNSLMLFDGRVRHNVETGGWERLDPKTGKYQGIGEGPILEIGSDEAHIRAFAFWNGQRVDVMTESNPIFGIQGAKLVVTGVKRQETADRFKAEWSLQYEIHMPVASSMRMLSGGMKMVLVGVGSHARMSGGQVVKYDNLFQGITEGLNEAIDAHSRTEMSSHGFELGTVGDYYDRTFRALGLAREDLQDDRREHLSKLAADRIHILAGESLVKTGVALLHTSYALLRGMSDGGNWRKHFRSIFENREKFRRFETLLGRLQVETSAGRKIAENIEAKQLAGESLTAEETSHLKKRFLLEGIDALLEGTGHLEKKLTTLLREGRRHEYLKVIDKFDPAKNPNFDTVTSMQDKIVLSAAAAYHVLGAVTVGKVTQDFMAANSVRLSGRSTNLFGTPNFNFDAPIFLQMVENLSVKQFGQSTRESSLWHTYYSGTHSQTILSALARSPEVERRTRMVGELLAIGYLGGSALNVAKRAVERVIEHGKDKLVTLDSSVKPNLLIGGVHFEPLSYTFVGMSEVAEQSLMAISDIVRDISYGKDLGGGRYGDWTQEELRAKHEEAKQYISQLRTEYQLTSGTPVLRGSAQLREDYVQVFKLMGQKRIGAPVLRFPVMQFEEADDGTHLIKDLSYDQISMISPDAVVKLQTFDDHTGDMLKLSVEVLRGNIVMRNAIKQASMTGGRISSQVRDMYESWLDKIHNLREKIREAGTTDIQKTMAAITNVGGFAMIANTIPGFDGWNFKSKKGKHLTIENTIVLGDEALMAVTDEAMAALRLARKHVRRTVVHEQEHDDPNKTVSSRLKGTVHVRKDGIAIEHGPLQLEDWLMNSVDTHEGSVSAQKSVGAILEKIQTSYNQARTAKNVLHRQQKVWEDIVAAQIDLDTTPTGSDLVQRRTRHNEPITVNLQDLPVDAASPAQIVARINRHVLARKAVKGTFGKEVVRRNGSINFASIEQALDKSYAQYANAVGKQEVFALRIQKHILERQLERAPSMSILAKEELKYQMGIVDEKLGMLSMSRDHVDTINQRHSQLVYDLSQTSNPRDRKQLQKMLEFVEQQRSRINAGFAYDSRELFAGDVSIQDIKHAFGAAGVHIEKMINSNENLHALNSAESAVQFIDSMQEMFSAKSLVNALQDAHDVRRLGIAIAMTRAGSPVGPGGVRAFNAMSIREFNRHLRDLGSSFNLDVHMGRRAMFLHMTGMAVGLGDFDGDNFIIATIKRYILLKTLQETLGGGGLLDVERSAEATIAQLKGANDDDVAEYKLFISDRKDREGRRLNLLQELRESEHEVHRGSQRIFVDHVESYLGLGEGSVAQIAKNLFGAHWSDAEQTNNKHIRQQLMNRTAARLNNFANDMYSNIENTARDMIVERLQKSGDMQVNYEVSDIETDKLTRIMQDSRFQKGLLAVYKKAAGPLLAKNLQNLFGGEHHVDTILQYGLKVAFASTKLIGNWTNVQTMQESLAVGQKMQTYSNLTAFKKDLEIAVANSRDPGALKQIQADYEVFRKQELNKADVIHDRVSGYMQRLEQATRDAIKLKAATEKGDNVESALLSMTKDATIKAIDASIALVQGRSVFGFGMEEFNRNSDTYKAMLHQMDADQLIKINPDGTNATLAAGVEELDIYKHFIDPHIQAVGQMAQAKRTLEAKWKGNHAIAAADQRINFTLDDLTQDERTTVLMFAHSQIKGHIASEQMKEYKKAVFAEDSSYWESARNNLSDQLKLTFLHDQLRGGRVTSDTAMQRMLSDVVQAYVVPGLGMDYMDEQARVIDPTGHFSHSLQYMAAGVLRGRSTDQMFEALRREEALHYKVLADIETELAGALKMNPLADQGQTGLHEEVVAARGMSETGIHFDRGMHMGIMAFAGLFAAGGVFAMGEEAQAAQVVTGERQADSGVVGHVADFAAMVTLGFNPQVAMKQMEMLGDMSDREKMVHQLAFVGGMGIGHIAGTFAAKSVAGFRGATNLHMERYGSVLSMATMMTASHMIAKFGGEFNRHDRVKPDAVLPHQITDDVDLVEAIAGRIQQVTESELGAPQECPAVIIDENGDPLPAEFGLTDDAVAEGISDEDGHPILAERRVDNSVGPYTKPAQIESPRTKFQKGQQLEQIVEDVKPFVK